MLKVLTWLFTVIFAFNMGAGVHREPGENASELQKKVQEHMDVIVDETAAMVDDVVEEVRKDQRVQNAEAFVDDVKEIVDNTRDDIEAHFGTAESAEENAAEETEETKETEDAEDGAVQEPQKEEETEAP